MFKVPCFINVIDRFIDRLGHLTSWFTLITVVVSFTIVVLRYAFDLGWIAMQESVLYMHSLVFTLGAAYTLKEDGHVRVDIFYHKMSLKNKARVNLFGTLFLLLPMVIFVFYMSFNYVSTSWAITEKSPEAGGLSFVYIHKTFILLMSVCLLLQAIAEILRNLLIVISSDPKTVQHEVIR
jgi:TRAP-type mannitol/chloroaromatic compound transport system permease small subunit